MQYDDDDARDYANKMRIFKRLLAGSAGLLLMFNCFEIVSPGHRGVVTRMGTVNPVPMEEGFHFKWPIDGVEEWCTQIQKINVVANAGSADLQTVNTQFSVNYRLSSNLTPAIRRELGRDYEANIIIPAVHESVKAVVARFQAAQLLEKRAEVREEIETVLQEKLNHIMDNAVVVSALNVENFSFEEAFNRAIEQKQVAEQEAQRARNEVEREKAEADKQIEQARGRAESRRLEAQASADAIRIEAEARAQAIELESTALRQNPDILKLRTIERWDGVMPRVMGADSSNFLLPLDMGQKTEAPAPPTPQPERR